MHIEKIIIDGFKSYRTKTIIGPLDRHFNAITGQNGSGKSNIFDAICFVLGISNTSSLRSESLQGLIYKNGQAGIQSASVTVVFNNEDKSISPPGFDDVDKIVVVRKVVLGKGSKYNVNRKERTLQFVQDMFQYCSLNIKNPRFLIQQGRIALISAMKPPEILHLIEETVGITLFEEKRKDTLIKLERNQIKLNEIDNIISEHLLPNLKKLEKERDEYNRFATFKLEYERLQRWLIAHKFYSLEQEMANEKDRESSIKQELSDSISKEEKIKKEHDELNKKIKEITYEKDRGSRSEIANIKKKIETHQDEIDSLKLSISCNDQEIDRLSKKIEEKEKEKKKLVKDKSDMESSVSAYIEEYNKINSEYEKSKKDVDDLEKQIHDVTLGRVGEDNSLSLSEHIEKEKKSLSDCKINLKRIEQSGPRLKQQKINLEEQLSVYKQEFTKYAGVCGELEVRKKEAEKKIKESGYDIDDDKKFIRIRDDQVNRRYFLKDEIDKLERNLIGITLEIDEREADKVGLDRTKVYGVVAKLIRMKNGEYSIAAESAASGMLYNIVVEDQETVKKIIQKGVLPRRSTILPLDNIRYRDIEKAKLERAKKIDPTAHSLIDDLEYDRKFEPAIKYAFGQIIYVESIDGAKQVTFDKSIRIRTVTKDGDIFDPAGTLSGGSKSSNFGILKRIQTYGDYVRELDELNNSIVELDEKIRIITEMKSEFEIISHELSISLKNRDSANYSDLIKMITDQIKQIEEEMVKDESDRIKYIEEQERAEKAIVHLQKQLEDWNRDRSDRMDKLDGKLRIAKQKLDENTKKKNEKEVQYQFNVSSIGNIDSAINEVESVIQNYAEEKRVLDEKNQKIKSDINALETEKNECDAKLDQISKDIAKKDIELKDLLQRFETVSNSLNEVQITIAKIKQNISQGRNNSVVIREKIASLRKEHVWIDQERRLFGVEKTQYDFTLYPDRQTAKKEFKQLQTEHKSLEMKVNKKVLNMYDTAKSEYEAITLKREKVIQEKIKIEEVLEEVEQKRKCALEQASSKINSDFKTIISYLIKGSDAHLKKVEYDGNPGFEFNFFLNGVHKSLTELSGGQKSLLALGLILSLLKFKPAPLYILDEVDAALDLSNTRNIAQLFQNEFTNSQFIVISLKEDFHKYANVLFRTSFKTTSMVERIARVESKEKTVPTNEESYDEQ